MIGPISGETNMAPIITAVELTFNPTDAITIAKTKIQTLTPRNSTPLDMEAMVASGSLS